MCHLSLSDYAIRGANIRHLTIRAGVTSIGNYGTFGDSPAFEYPEVTDRYRRPEFPARG